ncbi:hypothetical protein EXIGLDRAFT_265408 [Exidia glandulosa HHB12029]|uniref:Uncharacterized protein n=1 Tax=Exidia glandulosa HHB12029 TaxID=1314781 RepID=A0A165DQ05_EXIGL|nr:hypothetical protein EXIGLDRAFT_265408 [Exidia glandulosa HHB12029]
MLATSAVTQRATVSVVIPALAQHYAQTARVRVGRAAPSACTPYPSGCGPLLALHSYTCSFFSSLCCFLSWRLWHDVRIGVQGTGRTNGRAPTGPTRRSRRLSHAEPDSQPDIRMLWLIKRCLHLNVSFCAGPNTVFLL